MIPAFVIVYYEPKWEVSCVAARMPHEFIAVPECLLAVLAGVPLVVALVNAEMFGQMLTLSKGLVAYVANMRAG